MKIEFIDPICVPDVFATEMVSVEDMGGVFRFSFAVKHGCELVLVSRVCLLTSAVPEARRLSADTIAQSVNPLFRGSRANH